MSILTLISIAVCLASVHRARRTIVRLHRTAENLTVLLARHGVLVSRCSCSEVLIGNDRELAMADGWHGPDGCFRP